MLKGKRVMIYIWRGGGGREAEGQLQPIGRGSPPHSYFVCAVSPARSISALNTAVGSATGTRVVCAPLCPAGWAGMGLTSVVLQPDQAMLPSA